jgi:hypothetical protein
MISIIYARLPLPCTFFFVRFVRFVFYILAFLLSDIRRYIAFP